MPTNSRTIRSRRSFLSQSAHTAGVALALPLGFAIASGKKYKAAIIGRTGHGDYGHDLDTVFKDLENVAVAAVADENPVGLKKAQQRSGAKRTYSDYRDMLEKEKPDLVSIAPRQPDSHREMALAAIKAGAHIYMEKPITESPAEADDILTAARSKGIQIGVAHTRRFMDSFLSIKKLIEEGGLGDILQVRFQGKQDARVGGEDLIVLGSHDMDCMRFFFGDPLWCMASVTVAGRDIEPTDVHPGLREPYTVAGDTIHAHFQFKNNIACKWSSIKAEDWNQNILIGSRSVNKWGFEIYGAKRIISFQENVGTLVLDAPIIAPDAPGLAWRSIETSVSLKKPLELSHPIRNLIHAIETGGQPQCSGEDARWAVEMVSAVYHSQISKARVELPLRNRRHPLRHFALAM